jgi:hypothetical protein
VREDILMNDNYEAVHFSFQVVTENLIPDSLYRSAGSDFSYVL